MLSTAPSNPALWWRIIDIVVIHTVGNFPLRGGVGCNLLSKN
jgi:hypothetical protein